MTWDNIAQALMKVMCKRHANYRKIRVSKVFFVIIQNTDIWPQKYFPGRCLRWSWGASDNSPGLGEVFKYLHWHSETHWTRFGEISNFQNFGNFKFFFCFFGRFFLGLSSCDGPWEMSKICDLVGFHQIHEFHFYKDYLDETEVWCSWD